MADAGLFVLRLKIDSKIKTQDFSSALYDRLAILRYDLPLLKNRIEDIGILIEEFLAKAKQELGIDARNEFLPSDQLKNFSWPGNVKQLKTAVEWMVFCQKTSGDEVTSYDFPLIKNAPSNVVEYSPKQESKHFDDAIFDLSLREARDLFEYNYLSFILQKFEGNIARMAGFIDMDRTALHRKLKSMDISFIANAGAEKP